jgi:hypothetical protein
LLPLSNVLAYVALLRRRMLSTREKDFIGGATAGSTHSCI